MNFAQQAQPAEQTPSIDITAYQINLTLDPAQHRMSAQAAVSFTVRKSLAAVSFELNPALHVGSVVDSDGHPLSVARPGPQGAGIQVTARAPLKLGDKDRWTFTYGGEFDPNVPAIQPPNAGGMRFASIGDPVSYLLYPARWFPMSGFLTDRFTMGIRVHVPAGETVVGSGLADAPHPDSNGMTAGEFSWPYPGFPGTIIAGKFAEPAISPGNSNVQVYTFKNPRVPEIGEEVIAATAAKEYDDLAAQFGPAESQHLDVVELPDNTVPAFWAPEIAAIAGGQMNSSRLLTNTIAHQWWGNDVSPRTLNDGWITNGMSRYAELESLRKSAGTAAFADAILNISASALEFDSARLADVAQYPAFSPEFQAMTYDKGAMIFRMLQWQIGNAAFEQTLHRILSVQDRSISSVELEAIAETSSHQDLRSFFTQWLDNTGAPTLQDDWTLYRLGNNGGYRILGEIKEDLDLFRVPVDVRVETPAETVNQRVEVAGAQSQFVINTMEVPREIALDPDRWLLRSDPDMQVRVHILRGQHLAGENDTAGAVREYRQALAIDNISSLASYRLGELYFAQRNYQAAENAFRDALHGDDIPKWTEVWSNLDLGKIFDASGQRDRAVNQYREAVQTQDNTGGAVDLARGYLQKPYRPAP